MSYQDVIEKDGTVTRHGYRECEQRYAVVRRAMHPLRKPFTVLDLGASAGYFSMRLTDDFGARCVAVDRSAEVLQAEGRVAAVVHRDLGLEAIRRQGTFDVILALSFLHHQLHWRPLLDLLVAHTRSVLVVETPDPSEKLRQAVARHELSDIEAALIGAGFERIGSADSVWDPRIQRGIWVLRRNGISVRGHVEGGGGNNGALLPRFTDGLSKVLGYTPFPGSLNVRTTRIMRMGPYAMEYVDPNRGKGGRRGGDYQIWHARVDGYNGPCHVQRPGVRGHGKDVLEVWAPDSLRTKLNLENGDAVTLRIGA